MKKNVKKVTLRSETVRQLINDDLRNVAGGDTTTGAASGTGGCSGQCITVTCTVDCTRVGCDGGGGTRG